MAVKKFSATINVDDPGASRDFYVEYFGAKVLFDCGWYIAVSLDGCELCFMQPQSEEQPLFPGRGLTYNIEVDDVDGEHDRLVAKGLAAIIPLDDHPWGDRGFGVMDPNGVLLYIHKPIEPAEEFKQYYQ